MTTGYIMKTGHQDLIKHCHAYYRDDKAVLQEIFEFECEYVQSMDAVIWYTKNGFLYKCLNRALRSDNYDLIFKFRHIISELSSALTRLHSDFCHCFTNFPLTVYRGLRAPEVEIKKLQSHVGDLVGTNQYLSTTRNISTAKCFAGIDSVQNPWEVSIIFEIQIDPSIGDEDSVFGDINRWNWIGEDEILFNLGSIFQINAVACTSTEKKEWYVILKSGKLDTNETPYSRYLKQRSDQLNRMRPDIALARHLVDMGVSNDIESYLFECLQISRCNNDDDTQHSFIYDTLGRLCVLKKRPYQAIAYFTWAFNGFRAQHQAVEANEALHFLIKLTSKLLDPGQLLSNCEEDILPPDICADAYFSLAINDQARKRYVELLQTLNPSDLTYHIRSAAYLTQLARIDQKHSLFKLALDHLRTVLPDQHPCIREVNEYLQTGEDTADEYLPLIEISIVHSQCHPARKFLVYRSETIKDIKALLQRHFDVSYDAQILRDENERVLPDDLAVVARYRHCTTAQLHLSLDPKPATRRVYIQSATNMIEIADVHWWQSIYDIKLCLCQQSKLPPPEQQRLFESGQELSNDLCCGKLKYPTSRLLLALRDCELESDCEKPFNIHVRLPLSNKSPQWKKPKGYDKNETYSSNSMQDIFLFDRDVIKFQDISCHNTVQDLKTKINEIRGIPIQFQQILHEQTDLTQSTATLVSYGIKQNSILELQFVNVPSQITFLIQNVDSIEQITVNSDEDIEGLTKHVARKMGVSPERAHLEASDCKLAPYYHSILKVFQENPRTEDLSKPTLSVTVSNSDSQRCYGIVRLARSDHNETIELPLNHSDMSFDELRTLVLNATGIPIEDQRLYVDGELLCRGQTLDSGHVEELFVLRKQPAGFTVKISVSRQTLLRLFLCRTTTTKDLKRMVEHLRGVSVWEQRLFIGRAELSDPDEIIQTRASGRRIDVVRADEKKITFVRYKKRWLLFKIDPWKNVAKLKARIQSKLHVCLDQYLLLYNRVVLRLDDYPFWIITDKTELHLVRSRIHLDYIYVRHHGKKTIPVCQWSSSTTIDDVYQAIARLYQIPFVQPYGRSNEKLEPNSVVDFVRLISLRIIDPETRSIMNLCIESKKKIFELKQELHLDTQVQREFLYQNKSLSNTETVGKYDNATILIQSIGSQTLDDDRFDPLYIQRQEYHLDIHESCLKFDGSDEDAAKQFKLWCKDLKEFKRQAKYGDKIE